MRGIGVPSVLLDLIIDLHTAASARVCLAGRFSTSFRTTSGVRHGCVLAPALFCRAMDFIMEHVSHKVGIHVSHHSFTDIDYADVALLVAKEENFCTTLSAMDEEASKKIQNLGLRSTPAPVTVNGNTVDPVEEFTYLGSLQSSHSNSRPEYIRHIGLAGSAMKRLDCVWSRSNLSIPTKICIYSTCILPVLLYGSETWTLTQTDWKSLDSFHMRCQRRILHISWHDFVSNDGGPAASGG